MKAFVMDKRIYVVSESRKESLELLECEGELTLSFPEDDLGITFKQLLNPGR